MRCRVLECPGRRNNDLLPHLGAPGGYPSMRIEHSAGRDLSRQVIRPFLVCVLAFAPALVSAPLAERANVKVLLIGNAQYKFLPPLPAAEAGADALASAMRGLHFVVTEKPNLTREQLRDAIDNGWVQSLRPGDVCLVYYSGYGFQSGGDNYMVPVDFDTKIKEDPNVVAYDVGRLQQLVDQKQPAAKIFFLEASWQNDQLANWAGFVGLAPLSASSPGTYLVADAAVNRSISRVSSGLGLFTAALLRALQKPGLSLTEIVGQVQKEVSNETGNSQVPYPLGNAEFVFNPAPPPPPPKTVPASEPVLKAGSVRKNRKDTLDYAFVPAQTFNMGCVAGDNECAADEQPSHPVKISHPFWITTTEVTVKAYEEFTKANGLKLPKQTATNPKWRYTDRPISMVNWASAEKFCEWSGGRLPTEAEWELAAHGGKNDVYPWGNTFDPTKARYAKNTDNRFPEEGPVGTFPPNGFGLYDVAGNVREWTADVYNARVYDKAGPFVDPSEPGPGRERVVRGGSFNDGAKHLRISARDHADAEKEVTSQTGFRCILPQSALAGGK